MNSSFLSGFSDSSTRPLLEYSVGQGTTPTLVHVEDSGSTSGQQEYDIISTFKSDGFSDFELDLTCLSNPPSPILEASTTMTGGGGGGLIGSSSSSSEHIGLLELTPSTSSMPSPPPSTSLIQKRSPSLKSLSFFSSKPDETSIDTTKGSSSSSFPGGGGGGQLVKYVGRGTPIDPTRRIEWSAATATANGGGGGGSGGPRLPHISEHGVLFSSPGGDVGRRSHSLDSAIVRHGIGTTTFLSHRHSTQEWGGGGTGTISSSSHSHNHQHRHHAATRHHTISGGAPPPPPRALSPLLQLSLDTSPIEHSTTSLPESSKLDVRGLTSESDENDEWNRWVMDTVMSSSSSEKTIKPGEGSSSSRLLLSGSEERMNDGSVKDVYNPQTTTGLSRWTPLSSFANGRDSKVHDREGSSPRGGVAAASDGNDNEMNMSGSLNDFGMFGLDTAVDLGLKLGNGMNFFNLGLAPGSSDVGHHHQRHRASTIGGGGRDDDTPSVYSTAPPSPTPQQSPKVEASASVRAVDDDDDDDREGLQRNGRTSPTMSPSGGKFIRDAHHRHWWKRLFSQLRKLQMVLRASTASRHAEDA